MIRDLCAIVALLCFVVMLFTWGIATSTDPQLRKADRLPVVIQEARR